MLGGDEVGEPLHAAGASGRALLQAAFVVRHAEEVPGTVHVDDGEGEAVREQAGGGQALLLSASVSAGETGHLAAPGEQGQVGSSRVGSYKRSYSKRTCNEAPPLSGDSRVSKAMNSSGGREARGGCAA